MSKRMKPVWRLNTGKGVPSDYEKEVYPKCVIECCGILALGRLDFLWSLSRINLSVYAYETTRTKEAKYR